MKIYKLVLIVLVIGGCVYGGYKFNNRDVVVENKVVEVKATKSELENIIEEEMFKKETLLRARKVVNDRKKEQEENKYKDSMVKIESEYESIRQGELELVGTANLK